MVGALVNAATNWQLCKHCCHTNGLPLASDKLTTEMRDQALHASLCAGVATKWWHHHTSPATSLAKLCTSWNQSVVYQTIKLYVTYCFQ